MQRAIAASIRIARYCRPDVEVRVALVARVPCHGPWGPCGARSRKETGVKAITSHSHTHTAVEHRSGSVAPAGHGARDAEVALVVVTVLNLGDKALSLVSLVS